MTRSTPSSLAKSKSNCLPFYVFVVNLLTVILNTSLEQSVRDDIKFLESSPYIAKSIKLHGYVHDMLDSGRLIKV